MSTLSIIVMFFSVLPISQPPECVCIVEPHRSEQKMKADRKQAFERAAAVVVGKVVANDGYNVTVKLEKRWKGTGNVLVLKTGATPGVDGTPLPRECSAHFDVGDEYLIYAVGPPDNMQAELCLTQTIKDAAAEVAGLDEMKRHETITRNDN